MATTPKKEITPVDPFDTPKETWQYVAIPEVDVTDKKHPSIWLNKMEFLPGQDYHVPPPVAAYIKDRLRAFNRSVTRLFSPSVDRIALNDVSVGTTAGTTPSGHRPGYVDATGITTQ